MTKKFTEEQYRAIVEAWDAKNTYSESTKAVTEIFFSYFNESWKYDIGQALALGNETSREWAHEQFVEKEKKFVWTSKKINKYGHPHRLYMDTTRSISFTSPDKTQKVTQDEHLTESEIREWGYNPEMFDKEEVRD